MTVGEKRMKNIRRINGPNSLFWSRLKSHLAYQRSNISSVVDWTIALYIIIPGLLLGIGLYREFVTGPLPAWVQFIPLQGAAVVVLLLFSGRIMLFLEEADVLFLRQHPAWIKGVMVRGMIYSHLVTALRGLLLTALLLPVLIQAYGLTPPLVIPFLTLTVIYSWCLSVVSRMIAASFKGWRHRLWSAALRIVSLWVFVMVVTFGMNQPALMWGAAVMLMVLLLQLSRMRLQLHSTFMTDVREDAKVRVQLTEKLLTQAVGKPPSVRSKPWVFRKSRRLYKGSAKRRLASAGIKAFLRNPENLQLYLQITVFGLPAVWLPPHVIKLIVLAALLLLMSHWLNTRWAHFVKSDFLAVLPFTNAQLQSAGSLTVGTLLTLPAALQCIIAGMTMFTPIKGLLAGLALAALAVWLVPSLTSWSVYKEERGITAVKTGAAEAND